MTPSKYSPPIRPVSRLLLLGLIALLLFTVLTCSQSLSTIKTATALLSRPVDIALFPKSWINPARIPLENQTTQSTADSASTDDSNDDATPPPEPLIGYILNSHQGQGEIVLSEYQFSESGEVTTTFFSIYDSAVDRSDSTDEESETSLIPIGGVLKSIKIDANLKLAYVLLYQPARLMIIDLVNQQKLCFLDAAEQSGGQIECPVIEGLPTDMAVWEQPSESASHLYLANREAGTIVDYRFSLDQNRNLNPLDAPQSYLVGAQPVSLAKDPNAPTLYVGHAATQTSALTLLHLGSTTTLESFAIAPEPLPLKRLAFSPDGNWLFLLTATTRQIVVIQNTPSGLIRDPRNITLCNEPLDLAVLGQGEDADAPADRLFLPSNLGQLDMVRVPRVSDISTIDPTDAARNLIRPDVRCTETNDDESKNVIILPNENNLLTARPGCPKFYVQGIRSTPTIPNSILSTCHTQTDSWYLTYHEAVGVSGEKIADYLVESVLTKIQSKRAKEMSYQEALQNTAGYYVSANQEIKLRIVGSPDPLKQTSPGDQFFFSTYSGYDSITVGAMPGRIISDPLAPGYLFVVNSGTSTISVIRAVNSDYEKFDLKN